MKTTLMSRNVLKNTCYILLLFCISLSVSAQCPTIADPTPPLICDASGFTFNDLDAFATDGGNGIAWYDVAIGGFSFDPTQLVLEGTYYSDDSSGTCGSRASIVIDFQMDATGQNLDRIYCSNKNPTVQTYIDDVLQSSTPPGGAIEIFSDYDLTTLANPADGFPSGPSNLFMVFIDNGGCRSQLEIGKIGVFNAPQDPTPPSPQVFCASTNPILADLDPGTLATNFRWYQNIDGSGDPILPALPLSTPLVNNNTYYIQIDNFFCGSNPIPVTVNVEDPVDAGSSGILPYCEDSIPAADFNLFDELGGFPQVTGNWTGPLATTNGHLGTVNIATLIAGTHTFTYTIPTGGACPLGISTVTIIISEVFSSGTPSTTANPTIFCESGLPSSFDLTTLLNNDEDPNGLWTQGTLSTDPVVISPIDLSTGAFTLGTYNFTYTQNVLNPCSEESTTVQVVVLADPNAGTALNAIFCENELGINSPYNLFSALDGSQDNNGGTWTDAANATVTNPIDITGLTTTGSPYTFNYTIDNGTCSDTEPITITVQPAPESGTPIATFPEFCITEIIGAQTVNLFDLLTGEDQTGTWSDDDASGGLSGNLVTIDGLATGTYDFTFNVDAIGTCDDTNVTVSIIINDTASPTANATQEFCDTATVGDLTVLTGTTIQWYDDATGGTPLVGTNPLIDGETYYATQTDATTGCESSMRTLVTPTIYITPNSGNPNTIPISVCNNNSTDLFTGLDGTEDAGGVWQNTDGVGTLTGNTLDATGVLVGTYQFTYLITASAPCVDSSTIISVTIDAPLNAGTDNTLDVCSNNGTTDLFTLLGAADVGGTWSPALASGTGVFDPLVDVDGTYTYTHTNACGVSSSDVVVTVTQAPNAGTDNTAPICVIDGPTDLFTFLGSAQSGGVWSPALVSGTGVFDPLVDTNGVYRYTITATAPCLTDSTADITVTINDSPAPVVSNATPEFCLVDNSTVANLEAALTVTGTILWYEDAALTTPLNATDTLVDGEDYYATQTNSSGCESSTNVRVDVTINDTATPTILNAATEYCINDDPIIHDLTLNITEYNASTDNIIWYDAATNGSVISDSSILNHNMTYYAALVDATTGCESSVRLVVTTNLTSCGKLIIPDGFSPNGDGTNDTFDIDHLGVLYPNFAIEIFNRYGNMVYKGNDHAPRFDGTSNQSRTMGSGHLPVGVYFYIFYFNDSENKPEQGRLYLSR